MSSPEGSTVSVAPPVSAGGGGSRSRKSPPATTGGGASTVTFRRVPADIRRVATERFARKLEATVAGGRAFDCLIAGDAEIRRLNRDFRGQDCATDVLSFPMLAAPTVSRGGSLGDIAISWRRAQTQARRFGHSTESEIRVLMLHGVLHLLGMDHHNDAGRMARAEKRWRTRLGLPGGLIERVEA